jgi:hypothetical protein
VLQKNAERQENSGDHVDGDKYLLHRKGSVHDFLRRF